MLREPPRARDPPPPTLRCQPSGPIRRRHGRTLKTTATTAGHGRPAQGIATTPQGMNALRNGIAATARSASLPRLTGLRQFHPEDAAKRPNTYSLLDVAQRLMPPSPE